MNARPASANMLVVGLPTVAILVQVDPGGPGISISGVVLNAVSQLNQPILEAFDGV
jgi:hypothetical protein